MQTYEIEGWSNPDIYLERTFTAEVLSQVRSFVNDYPTEETAGVYPPES